MSGSEWVSVHDRLPEQGLWVLLAGGRVGSRSIDILGLAAVNSWDRWVGLSGSPMPETVVIEFWHPLPDVAHLVPHALRKREGSPDEEPR